MPLQHFSWECVILFSKWWITWDSRKLKRSVNPINKFHLLVLNEKRSTIGSITSVEHLLLACYSVMTAYQKKFCLLKQHFDDPISNDERRQTEKYHIFHVSTYARKSKSTKDVIDDGCIQSEGHICRAIFRALLFMGKPPNLLWYSPAMTMCWKSVPGFHVNVIIGRQSMLPGKREASQSGLLSQVFSHNERKSKM